MNNLDVYAMLLRAVANLADATGIPRRHNLRARARSVFHLAFEQRHAPSDDGLYCRPDITGTRNDVHARHGRLQRCGAIYYLRRPNVDRNRHVSEFDPAQNREWSQDHANENSQQYTGHRV